MYKTIMTRSGVVLKGENEKNNRTIMFHGGCQGCTRQQTEKNGVDFCVKCQCFDSKGNMFSIAVSLDG